MRKLLALALAAILFAACSPTGSGGADLASMSLGDAYYVASSASGSRAITGGSLHYVDNGGTGVVTFLDAEGNSASVTVNSAIQLSDSLALAISYDGESGAIIVNASGEVVQLEPAPDNLECAREDAGSLYYVSGGSLYAAPLATGIGVLRGGGATLAADCYIKVTSYGGVIAWPPSSADWYWYAPGTTTPLYTNAQFSDPRTSSAFEGLDGTIYLVNAVTADLIVTTYAESGTAGSYTGTQETIATLPWGEEEGAVRLSSPRSTGDLMLGREDGLVRFKAVAGGGYDYSVTEIPTAIDDLTWFSDLDTENAVDSAVVYHAYHERASSGAGYDEERWHLWSVNTGALTTGARALGSATEEIIVDYNVAGLAVVGGLLFYQRDTGGGVQTMVYDGTSASVYADASVAIEAVE